jgi:phosphopantetheine adenylyltransferase
MLLLIYHLCLPNYCSVVGGLIWRTVKRQGADIFVRGIRSWDKDGAEERGLQILNTWGPIVLGPLWWPVPTIFVEGKPEYNHVSSTLIRDICSNHTTSEDDASWREPLATLVPENVVDDVARLYGETR